MIIRGGGAIGAAGLAGAALCIWVTLLVADGAVGACRDGGVARGGTAIAGGAALVETDGDGVLAAGGVAGTLGGITTTEGGRYVAATEAGVTILGAGGVPCGASVDVFGATAFGVDEDTNAAGADALALTAGGVTGGLAGGWAVGASAAPFLMARSTSPGREIFDRSIFVLIPSSLVEVREVFEELGAASDRPRRCFRTRSAS
jgi:hypothetical protein